MRILLKRVR